MADLLRRALLLALVGCGLTLPLSGCRIGYYAQAALGQARIVFGREPIEDVLARPDLDPEWRRKLRLIEDLRRFAFDSVGLVENDNYTTFFDLEGEPLVFTLVACPLDSLDNYIWTFPLVGALPYIGFFDKESARTERQRLEAEGYEVHVGIAAAYSTLGWFSDPVLSSMLSLDDEDLAELILHEQTHVTIYVEDDIAFNENIASFVGHAAALRFFELRGEPLLAQRARAKREDQLLATRFCAGLVEELRALYDRGLPRRETLRLKKSVFARHRMRFRREYLPRLKTDRYRWFARMPSSNALVSTLVLYNREIESLEELHAREGGDLERSLELLRSIAKAADPSGRLRRLLGEGDSPGSREE